MTLYYAPDPLTTPPTPEHERAARLLAAAVNAGTAKLYMQGGHWQVQFTADEFVAWLAGQFPTPDPFDPPRREAWPPDLDSDMATS